MEGYGLRVLVADNCHDTRVAVSELLAEAEYNVHFARDIVEVCRQLISRRYDVIVASDQFPGLNSLEFLSLSQALCPQTPLVVIAYAKSERAQVALRRGAHAWISTPHESDAICKAVRSAAMEKAQKYAVTATVHASG